MSRLPHRQILLFLGAVIVPSVVPVGLGIRTAAAGDQYHTGVVTIVKATAAPA